jgi:SAM-dependent methyltransferase
VIAVQSRIETEGMSDYQDIAAEYYDPLCHPTCRDLRDLSLLLLKPRLESIALSHGSLVEIGVGLSILAPTAAAHGLLGRVILLDRSQGMLDYSRQWITRGARALVASADATHLPSASVSVIVSSLGDPYNAPAFWTEVARILEPDGYCVFTAPSYEWSSCFRLDDQRDVAEFIRSDGKRLSLPSHVQPECDQVHMMEAAGLWVVKIASVGTAALGRPPAEKLTCISPDAPAVSCFIAISQGDG